MMDKNILLLCRKSSGGSIWRFLVGNAAYDDESLKILETIPSWIVEIFLQKRIKNLETNDVPLYIEIEKNKSHIKHKKREYNKCNCYPGKNACTAENNCVNVLTYYECDPDLCLAGKTCQNQNFRRGGTFSTQIKKTDKKGYGLFANENIPSDKFLIEYRGEIIDHKRLNDRFEQAKADKNEHVYFMKMEHNVYIDATVYGNKSRFVNHSCSPNTKLIKWISYSEGLEQMRMGLFTSKNIFSVYLL